MSLNHGRAPLKIQSSPKCKARKKFHSAAYDLYVSKKFFPQYNSSMLLDFEGCPLHHAPLRKRKASRPRNNEVIQYAHIHQRQCLFQRIGKQVVGLAGFGDT